MDRATGGWREAYRTVLLPVFAAVLLAALWAAAVYEVAREHAAARQEAVLRTHEQARTLAENASFLLRQADHATGLFRLKYEETAGTLRLAEFTRHGGLLASVVAPQLELPIALYDAGGRLIDSRHGAFSPQVAGESWFAELAAGGDAARFSNPLVDPRTTKWQIRVARRLADAHGAFAGAIVLHVDPALFVADQERLPLGPGTFVALQSRDTALAAGRIGDEPFIGPALPFSPVRDGGTEEAVLRQPFDRVERLYAFREMPRFALVAIVGHDVHRALARFERRRDMYVGAITLASFAVLACTAILMRQARRLRERTRAAHEAQRHLRAAADASLDAVFLLKACDGPPGTDADFVLVDLNERAAQLLGCRRADAVGRRIGVLVSAWRTEGFIDKYVRVLETGQPLEEEFATRTAPQRWLQHQIVAIDDGVAVTARDITARKRSELASRQNEAELAAVNDASPLGLMRSDRHGLCTYVNRTFEALAGMTRDAALGEGWLAALHPEDRPGVRAALDPARPAEEPFQALVRLLRPDGTLLWASVKVAPILVDGRVEGFVSALDDVTPVRTSIMALRESEARLRTLADMMPAMIAYVDADEIYRFQNLVYEREFTRMGVRAIGRSAREIVGERRYAQLEPYVRRALEGETVAFEEDEDGAPAGPGRSFEVRYIPQWDETGNRVAGFHVVRSDVTDARREKQHLLHLSRVDALTGLTNRGGFMTRLSDAMAGSRMDGTLMAVMYMDIDRFKPVNDTHGHAVGDTLLKAFAGRLTHALRASDTVARLGGDEFTAILERIARPEDALQAAAKIVAAMAAPFHLDGLHAGVSTSIGVAFHHGGDTSAAELLHRADLLLYEAKQGGRNTYRAGSVPGRPGLPGAAA